MKSNVITNLLLLVVIILAVWALRETFHDPQQNTLGDITGIKAVSSIVIRRPDTAPIGLIEKSGQWHMQQPHIARASDQRANLILSLLDTPVHSEFYPFDDIGLQGFGLAQPRLTLQLDQALLLFGDVEPLSGHRYVMHKGVIYLIGDGISPLLQASAGSFVEPRLLPENARIQRLNVPLVSDGRPSAQRSINLILQQGSWRSDAGRNQYSSDELVQLVQSWRQAYAMQVGFMADNTPPANAAPVRIWLQDEDQPLNFWAETSSHGLIISHPEARLRYLFPAMMLDQMFLQDKAD